MIDIEPLFLKVNEAFSDSFEVSKIDFQVSSQYLNSDMHLFQNLFEDDRASFLVAAQLQIKNIPLIIDNLTLDCYRLILPTFLSFLLDCMKQDNSEIKGGLLFFKIVQDLVISSSNVREKILLNLDETKKNAISSVLYVLMSWDPHNLVIKKAFKSYWYQWLPNDGSIFNENILIGLLEKYFPNKENSKLSYNSNQSGAGNVLKRILSKKDYQYTQINWSFIHKSELEQQYTHLEFTVEDIKILFPSFVLYVIQQFLGYYHDSNMYEFIISNCLTIGEIEHVESEGYYLSSSEQQEIINSFSLEQKKCIAVILQNLSEVEKKQYSYYAHLKNISGELTIAYNSYWIQYYDIEYDLLKMKNFLKIELDRQFPIYKLPALEYETEQKDYFLEIEYFSFIKEYLFRKERNEVDWDYIFNMAPSYIKSDFLRTLNLNSYKNLFPELINACFTVSNFYFADIIILDFLAGYLFQAPSWEENIDAKRSYATTLTHSQKRFVSTFLRVYLKANPDDIMLFDIYNTYWYKYAI